MSVSQLHLGTVSCNQTVFSEWLFIMLRSVMLKIEEEVKTYATGIKGKDFLLFLFDFAYLKVNILSQNVVQKMQAYRSWN